MSVAVVTGASRGLGRALAKALASKGWSLVIDARAGDALGEAERDVRAAASGESTVVAVTGDVTDPQHRSDLIDAAKHLGGLDLLVNNASTLGTSPLPHLVAYRVDELRTVFETNTLAPLALIQDALPLLVRSDNARVLNITSDASVEAYEGWGGYGASKAALDHLGAVLGTEEPTLRVWTIDPGDMRTQMHQDAFPGEDISDRPLPESVVPRLVELIDGPAPSGRYRVDQLVAAGSSSAGEL